MVSERTDKTKQKDKSGNVALICLGFGATLFVEAYVLGVLLGGWLDQQFATKPLFTLLGVLLALFGSFYQLYRMLTGWRPARRNGRRPPADRHSPEDK